MVLLFDYRDKASDQSTNTYTQSHSSIGEQKSVYHIFTCYLITLANCTVHGDEISVVQCVTLAYDAFIMWINLGMALGLKTFVLASIHQRHERQLLVCFADMFDQWLQLSTPQHPAKWSTLITALQSIGKMQLANIIQTK